MKDCFNILQQKYFEAINGVVMSNGKEVKFYDSVVPENAVAPYIVISGIVANESSNKESYGQEVYVTLDIFTKFANSFGGRKQASIISDQVIQLIRTRQAGYLDLSPDFYMILSELDNTNTLEVVVTDGVLVQRTIRFKHLIQEV